MDDFVFLGSVTLGKLDAMRQPRFDILHEVLTAPIEPAPWRSLDEFRPDLHRLLDTAAHPIDAAIRGGFRSDVLAGAFVAGYQSALQSLFPDLPRDRIVSLCVTEQGGGHPRAILTRLEKGASGTYTLTGDKRWSTLSNQAGLLLVVAREAEDPATNRAVFRVVRVAADAPGVSIVPMPETPFVPEIRHAEVSLRGVVVHETGLLPGDGYELYVKPFRTVEDIHVHAAGAGYLMRLSRRYNLDKPLMERLVHVISSLTTLAAADPKDPVTHIVLAGVLEQSRLALQDFDSALAAAAPDVHAKFMLDKPIFSIAARVRAERTTKAWERLSKLA